LKSRRLAKGRASLQMADVLRREQQGACIFVDTVGSRQLI
jgi:hypothetical protein